MKVQFYFNNLKAFNILLFGLILTCFLFAGSLKAQVDPQLGRIKPGTLKNGVLSVPYDMVGSWSESFRHFHYVPPTPNFLGPGDAVNGGNGNYMNFRLMFPVGYDSLDQNQTYPIILFLHGAGESGRGWGSGYATTDQRYDNNSHQLVHGGRRHRDAVLRDPSHPESFHGFLLFPQSHNSGAWAGNYTGTTEKENANAALNMLEILIKHLKIDPNRIYVHGLSAGGQGTWEAILRRPHLFAAASPVSGAGNAGIHVPVVRHIPIWISQGGTDNNPNPQASTTMLNALVAAGVPYVDAPAATNTSLLPIPDTAANYNRYSLYPTLGHGVWNNTFNRRDFFQWILSKKKNQLRIFGNSTTFCPGDSILMGLSTGFEGYEWRRNGQIVAAWQDKNEVWVKEPGVYQVRYKNIPNVLDIEWSNWSEQVVISERPVPPQPRIISNRSSVIASGVFTLTGPDGYGNGNYQWYFNGVSLGPNERGQILLNRGAAGVYSLAVKGPNPGDCFSPLQNFTVYLVSESQLSVITPPSGLAGVGFTTSVSLTWNDNSSDETGFEIHRKLASENDEGWRLYHITDANATSYVDTGLQPNTTYQYRIKAIKPTGASNYTSVINITTTPDTEAPSAVPNLWGTVGTDLRVTLTWEEATDNVGVKEYKVYQPNSTTNLAATVTELSYTFNPLNVDTEYTFYVSAVDNAGNESVLSSVQIKTLKYIQGISYKYYQGDWTMVPNFSLLTPVKQGINTQINLNPRIDDDFFGFWYDGFVEIDPGQGGDWTFWTRSDDGSLLYINNTLVVNNDGTHGERNRRGVVNLSPGKHRIQVMYFERSSGEFLQVRYRRGVHAENTYNSATQIPENKLFTFWDDQPPTEVSNLVAIPTDASMQLTWDEARDNVGIKGYKIYNAQNQLISFTESLQFIVEDLDPLVSYTFRVVAVDVYDNESSGVSITETTLPTTPPQSPNQLTAIPTGPDRIQVRWRDNSFNETAFHLERKLTIEDESAWMEINSFPRNTVQVIDSGLLSNTSYAYRVRASNLNLPGGGYSGYSNVLSARTLPDIPNVPSNLQIALLPDSSSFQLQWNDNSSNEHGFEIWKSLNVDEGYSLLATLNPNTTSYIDTEIPRGTRFFYKIRAFNQDGNSNFTPAVGVMIPGPLNISPVNWKLIPVAFRDDDEDNQAIKEKLMNGEDYLDEISLPTWGGRRVLRFQLPAMPDDGMFVFSFRNPDPGQALQGYDPTQEFGGMRARIFYSDNSTDGLNGDWIQGPAQFVSVRNNDLQKVNISRSYQNKWVRIELENQATNPIFIKEFGLYQFIPGARHNYIVLLGASLMEGMDGHREFYNHLIEEFPDMNLQPVVFNLGISGSTAGELQARIDQVIAQHPRAGYFMIHTGGNNVSQDRPVQYADVDGLKIKGRVIDPIVEIIGKIKNAGIIPIVAPLTFRDYKSFHQGIIIPNQPVMAGEFQERGSLPYNISLFEVIKEHTPDFYNFEERRPWVDIYGAILNNQAMLSSFDGVHHSNTRAFRQMWIDMAFKYIYTGERNPPVIWEPRVGSLEELVEQKIQVAENSMLLSDIWHAKIFAQQVGDRFNRLAFLDRLDSLERPIHFYLKETGANPAQLNSWSDTPDGHGVSPAQFKFDRQVFVVDKNTTLNQNWEVNGFRNRVKVATGAKLTVNRGARFYGTIDLDSAAVFENYDLAGENPTHLDFVIGELHPNSTVVFRGGRNHRNFNDYAIPPGVYGNLDLGIFQDVSDGFRITFIRNLNYRILGDLRVSSGVITGGYLNAPAFDFTKIYIGGDLEVTGNARFNTESTPIMEFEFNGGKEQQLIFSSSNINRNFRFFRSTIKAGSKVKMVNGSAPYSLVIGVPGSSMASFLLIEDGASLDIGSNNLFINAIAPVNSLNQKGKILSNGGNITFNTTSALNSNLYFDSLQNRLNSLNIGLTHAGSGTIHIRSAVDISQKLDVKAGNLNSNGYIRLLSDASSTAFIDRVGASANISGEFTVQRFLPQQPRRWRYMAFPVQGFSVEDLQATMPVTGNFEGTTTGYNRNPTIYEWDDVWAPFPAPGTSNQEIFDLGKGYSVHTYIANRPMTVEAKGTIATKTFNFDLKYSAQSPGNWNLLGNPFAAPISWTSLNGWVYDTAKVAGSIYINAYSGTGISTQTFAINKSGVGDSSHILISPGQAFWVQTRATSPTLQVNENAKVLNNSSLIFRTDGTEEEQDIASSEDENALPVLKNILRFTVVQGGFRDNAYLHFRDDAFFGFDPQFDAHKRLGSIAAIGSMSSDSLSLAINSMPRMLCERTIGLTLRNVVNATYQLELSRTHEFDYMVDFALIDHFTGDTVSFSQFTNYSFTCSNDAGSKRVDRFSLLVSPKPIQEISSAIVAPFCEGESSGISLENVSKGFYYFAMHDGVAVTDTLIASGNNLYLPFIDSLPVGQLQLELYRGIDYCGFDVVYSIAVLHSPLVAISDLSPVKVCKDENFHIDFPDLPEGATVHIYNQVNDMMPMVSSMEKTVFMNALSGSRNYYFSISNAFGCEHPDRKLLPIEVKAYPTPSITHRGAFLTSSSDKNNQWYWNNVPIPNANSQTIFIQGMGQFQVEVQYEECTKVSVPLMIGRSFQANAYPNPAKDYIIFTLDNPDGEEFDIEIHNMRGVVVQRMDKSTDDFYIVDLKGMSNGVYVFRARSATKNVAIRFVKI